MKSFFFLCSLLLSPVALAADCERVLTLDLLSIDQPTRSDLTTALGSDQSLFFLVEAGDTLLPVVMIGAQNEESSDKLERIYSAYAGADSKVFRGLADHIHVGLAPGALFGMVASALLTGFSSAPIENLVVGACTLTALGTLVGWVAGLYSCHEYEYIRRLAYYPSERFVRKKLSKLKQRKKWNGKSPLVIIKNSQGTNLKQIAAERIRAAGLNNARQISFEEFQGYLDFRTFAEPDDVTDDLAISTFVESAKTGVSITYADPKDPTIDPRLKVATSDERVLASPLEFMQRGILNIISISHHNPDGSLDRFRKKQAIGYTITIDGRTSVYLPLVRDPEVQRIVLKLYYDTARMVKSGMAGDELQAAYVLIGKEVQRVSADVKVRIETQLAEIENYSSSSGSPVADFYDQLLSVYRNTEAASDGSHENPRIAE